MTTDTRDHNFESESLDAGSVHSLLNSLRYRLSRNQSGKWYFSHVHFADSQAETGLPKNLMTLMENRTLNQLLMDLADHSDANIQVDCTVKIEFRKYFAELRWLLGPEEKENE